MPSQYRHGESAGLASVQTHPQSSYAMPCTPQAHCRYEPPLSYHGPSNLLNALTFQQDTESTWFPATTTSGFETTRYGSPPETMYNFQQPSELPIGRESSVVGSSIMGSSVVLPRTETRSETRWSPARMNCARAVPIDIVTTLHGVATVAASFDMKPTVTGSNMGPWSHEVRNPVTVATDVDLNAPTSSGDPAPATTQALDPAVPRPSSSAGALGASTKAKGAKAGSSRKPGVRGKGKSVSAPASPSELRRSNSKETKSLAVVHKSSKKGNVTKAVDADACKRVVSQRENHIWSERERRKGMNYLFNTLRSLLPHPVDKTDKSTVVGEIIKYIQSLQVKLEVMTTKQQVMLATRSGFRSRTSSAATALLNPGQVLVSNGLTLVDHSSDPTCMTAVTALPPAGKESCLQSFLGANVGIHVCGRNVFITTSSPRGRRGLFQELLLAIHEHDLDIINATISTSNASIFHCLHCQTSQDAELLNHNLHSALQSVITNFGSQF